MNELRGQHPVRPSWSDVDDRLDSWKEIATYLQRTVATVKRWEKKEGLPAHRHVHNKQATVYASRSEIDTWLENRDSGLDKDEPAQGFRFFSENKKTVVGVAGLIIVLLAFFWPFGAAPLAEAINSIAVLPFENQTNDTDMDYLSDGIANSIISSLSQISGLKVMSSSSVRRYKGTNADPQVVAEELGVGAVLLGRVLQPGDTLSIQVELVDTQDNTQLWGAQYSRQPDEILALQEDIAREISDKLRLQLSGEEQAQLAKQGTTNPEAYQDYLRGRYHTNKRAPADVANGI